MDDNVVMYGDREIPMSDAQIEQLEAEQAIVMVGWKETEAQYTLTDVWIEGCTAIGAHPLEAALMVLWARGTRPWRRSDL